MQVITSKDNEQIKQIKKLKDKKYRDENKKYLVEGTRLIEDAIQEKADIDTIIICEECIKKETLESKLLYEIAKYNCIYVNKTIFDSITDVKNPQGVMAVMNQKEKQTKIDYKQDVIVILDNIQDPGNMGTILRTVDSVGLNQIIISKNSADVYNTKVIRSTMGAIFRINIIESDDLTKTLKTVQKNGFTVMTTDLHAQESIYDIEYSKTAIIIGNEANGVSKELLQIADKRIKIPMLGKTESLNASVATGIILYEYVRQKLAK